MFFLLPSSVSQRLNPTLERAGGLWLFFFSFFFSSPVYRMFKRPRFTGWNIFITLFALVNV